MAHGQRNTQKSKSAAISADFDPFIRLGADISALPVGRIEVTLVPGRCLVIVGGDKNRRCEDAPVTELVGVDTPALKQT
jgi:hypothetical protein